MISVVILTLNEAVNLPRCLASVAWSDDVVVLDSGSTDATVAVAQAHGARVLTRAFDSFAGQRNFAMEQAGFRHPWVLHLDADEVVTPALRDELLAIAGASDAPGASCPVYRVAAKIIFMGRWLKHAGMYPSYQVRFGRLDALRFIDHGHGQREVQTPDQVGTLQNPLDHYNFSKGVNDWFARHLRYAEREAGLMLAERKQPLRPGQLFSTDATCRRRALKRFAGRLPLRPWLRFFYAGVLRGGFLDGIAGLRYARMLAIYQSFIDLMVRERLEDEWRA
ncbi:MAG: glycosyltransferase family 2 protein [Thermomonas sp.]|uniref:glycosyltransferase family 2 protein n=1 Tax=Thermomonas sp. TaxID=1971895 RepID=UPI002607A7DA|nr:glycosyltransferase family 2 protein [Thermomonas sp.]MCC7097556.1 glycosyltransferase family 2 protein [Thermomonas sp.]